jgi:hypothetical protein
VDSEADLHESISTRASAVTLGLRGEKFPFVWNAFQGVGPHVFEFDAGACDKIFHRPGDQDATRFRVRHDAGTDVDGNPADVVAHHFAFAGVDAPRARRCPVV